MTPAAVAAARAALAAVTGSAAAVVVAAVGFNFFEAHRAPRPEAVVERSPVATGTMTAYFAGLWALLRFRVGAVPVGRPGLALALAGAGTALVVAGAAVNVAGRLRLGGGWADQVKVYADHALVTDGVYRLVRHPLYGSLTWMALGASIEFANVAALLSVLLVFLPMMVFRARQEERVLAARFPEYAAYRRRVGMLFPRPSPPEEPSP